ncbi:MAG: molybdopterin biosynthesis protein [Oscillospiraceae bacterium]|nr:molybdopterin biosynthesis protein [Oscillospiraceae bacterium]
MGFIYLTNIQLDKAREEYLKALIARGMQSQEEVIPVTDASNRITSKAIYARICAPHYNACAMDGIALDAKITFGASETTPVTLRPEQYKYVDTGDPLPEGCDAVVMIEDVIDSTNELPHHPKPRNRGSRTFRNDGGIETTQENGVKLYEAVAPWQHIRQIGEDICAGEMILPSYSNINPAALGAMIASGVTEVSVIKRPTVGFIPTGDEIVPPTSEPGEGEILEFNSVIYTAMLNEMGAMMKTYPIVKDNAKQICAATRTALSECDIVLIGAGSSAGREDHTASVIAEIGKIVYHGIAIKPGKPAILGHCGVKPLMGLPGYPVSGIIVIEQLLRPIIECLTHTTKQPDKLVEATLSKSVVSTLKYHEFVRVKMGYVNDELIVSPLGRGSGIVTSFMRADGILEVPQGVEGYESGTRVNVRLLKNEEELRQSLVIIGSHDPLIDELSDLMRIKYGDISISSSHVGSMGGLLAIKKGEAHIAGTHLLDEKTGEYNTSFIRKLIPDKKVKLIECVKRKQGLILAKENPKKITCAADLTQEGVRFVNRQKGSGTRILMDYLCRKDALDTSKIYGYDREEFTHTSVAALIAANSADAGLGVYSAAKMYGLDFVHICDEQFDLLVSDDAWALPMVQKLIEVLKSDEFRKRLEILGGYILDKPGVVRKGN